MSASASSASASSVSAFSVLIRVIEGQARAYRPAALRSVAITLVRPVAFLAAIGVGLGTLVDRGSGGPAGVSYLAFLAPGLLAAGAMQLAASEAGWPVRLQVRTSKTLVAASQTPADAPALALGLLTWVALRVLFGALAFAVALVVVGATGPAGAALAVVPALLVGLAIGGPVIALAVLATRDQALVAVQRFGIVPAFLFSGTFFPLDRLPVWIRPLAWATPTWHGVELARAAALSTSTACPVWAHVAVPVLWAVAGAWLAVAAVRRRLYA